MPGFYESPGFVGGESDDEPMHVASIETTEGSIEVVWESGFVTLVTPLGATMLDANEAIQLETALEKVRLMNN